MLEETNQAKGRRRGPQVCNKPQDFLEYLSGNGELGHLEDDVTAVAHDLRADLDNFSYWHVLSVPPAAELVRKLRSSCQRCPRGVDHQQWKGHRPCPAGIATAARDPKPKWRLRSLRGAAVSAYDHRVGRREDVMGQLQKLNRA